MNPSGFKRSMSNNVGSSLLTSEENELLFKMLGPKCQTQVSAVAQIYGTDQPNHKDWVKRLCGLITFTKDNSRRSYFIQCYDMDTEQKAFEQELYNQFSYHISTPFFHQFEGDNQMIGINFADEGEAESFGYVVNERLLRKQKNREARQRKQQDLSHSTSQGFQPPVSVPSPSLSVSMQSLNKTKSSKGKKSNKISKDEISAPMDFKHITHVGFDEDKGFSSFNVDKDLDQFFEKAGVSQKFLQHNEMRKFIYKFIDENGGIEKATEENKVYGSIKKKQETPNKPSLPARSSGNAPPPPPRPPVIAPVTAPPPPPPKDKATFDRNQINHKKSGAPPRPPPRVPIVESSVPAPPAPPAPAPAPPPPPPPVPMPADSLQNSDARSDLLAQIRQRPLLNHVDHKEQEKPADSRSNLMNEIRNKEFQLKPVTKEDSGNSSPSGFTPPDNSMAAMLAQALMSRAKVIMGESESEEEDDDDEEWDDT